MSEGREHSRSGPAARHGASSGANQIRGDQDDVDAASAGPDGTPPHADAADSQQAFARTGQFTGRSIPEQDVDPASLLMDARLEEARLGAPGPGAPGGIVSGDIVSGDISLLQQELAETTGHLQRMAADFDNFRKRAIREREMASQMADAKLLGELLVVLDDFDRALEGAAADGATVESVCEGVKMVDGRLRSVLTAAGLEEVAVDGQFDPHLHEALLVQPGSGKPEGEIIQVVQRGYLLKDRVIRHAKVIVAGAE